VEKEEVIIVEEGGLIVYTDMNTDVIKLAEAKREAYCPNCGTIMELSGRCKICAECGWSSCDL